MDDFAHKTTTMSTSTPCATGSVNRGNLAKGLSAIASRQTGSLITLCDKQEKADNIAAPAKVNASEKRCPGGFLVF